MGSHNPRSMSFTRRIVVNVALAVRILFLPWWFTVLLAAAHIFMFQAYEIIVWGFVADTLYGAPIALYYNVEFFSTLLFAILVILIVPLKHRLIFYRSL